jgi:hypothetical protein
MRVRAIKTLEDARKQLQRLATQANGEFSQVGHDHDGSPESKLAQANTHESADTDSATTALHHTLGTGANQAAAGDDSRLSDARTPTAHASTHMTGDDKLQLSATSKVLGRKSAGAGDIEELTLSEVLDFVGSSARGDILVRGASAWGRLAKGTEGYYLKAGADDPEWAAVSAAAAAIRATNDFRLTLESGVPVSTTDQTAKTIIYACPKAGGAATQGQAALLGTDNTTWAIHSFTQLSLFTSFGSSCSTTSGSPIVAVNSSDVMHMVVGETISGTGIAGGSVIASIDSATQITMNNNATATGTNTLTFALPASKNYDLFFLNVAGTVHLVFGPVWTNDTTRATAITQKDGVPVLSGAFVVGGTSYAEGRLRHVGAVRTTTTAGQTADMYTYRYIWSRDNQVRRKGYATNSTASWSYSTAAWRESNNGTGAIRCNFLVGARTNIEIVPAFNAAAGGGITGYAAVMIDGTTSAATQWVFLSTGIVQTYGTRNYEVETGAHYATMTEYVSGASVTYYCSGSTTSPGYGSEVFFWC